MPQKRPSAHVKTSKPSVRRSAPKAQPRPASEKREPSAVVAHIPTRNGELLLTRRHFLYGAIGLGAVAAAAGGAAVYSGSHADDGMTTLEVAESNVWDLNSFTEVETDSLFSLEGSFELPFGSLVWSNSASMAVCLMPTDSVSPLTQVGILNFASGVCDTVLEEAQGADDGFDIYDVRATDAGLLWTEANILENTWRIFTAPLKAESAALGDVRMVDEGGGAWETPSIAAVKSSAFWQVRPRADSETAKTDPTVLKRASFSGTGDVEELYSSKGRSCTPLYATTDGVVITPYAPGTSTYCQLTFIRESDGATGDTLVLPSGMQPLEAAYGTTGFAFCFENIYNYGGGISNLGTYTLMGSPSNGDYTNRQWFRFNRTPSAAPSWCKNYFVVKSTQSICALDLAEKTYAAFGVESGCTDWGDYLASSGTTDNIVSVLTIDNTDTSGTVERKCIVRVWSPL